MSHPGPEPRAAGVTLRPSADCGTAHLHAARPRNCPSGTSAARGARQTSGSQQSAEQLPPASPLPLARREEFALVNLANRLSSAISIATHPPMQREAAVGLGYKDAKRDA